METWVDEFSPVANLGWGVREGQEKLGNAIIKVLTYGGTLVGQAECGTGKSLASLIPVIHKIKDAKANKKTYRAVVSTETLTLQRQLDTKDLPFLKEVYGGFTYKKLLGRSNYICFNRAKEEAKGQVNTELLRVNIDSKRNALTSGEKEDVERVLGRSISKDEWSSLSGSSEYCADNQCDSDECFGSKAREEALLADIVVVNHSILAIDYNIKSTAFGMDNPDGMFGQVNAIIVDEAHKLEEVLSNQWSEKFTDWEIADHLARLVDGVDLAYSHNNSNNFRPFAADLDRTLLKFFETTKDFFSAIEDKYGRTWDNSENPLSMQFLEKPTDRLRGLMNEFEAVGPSLTDAIINNYAELSKYLVKTLSIMVVTKASGPFKKIVRKSITSLNYLNDLANLIGPAMQSKDGIVSYGGMVYGVTVNGWTSRKTDKDHMSIRAVPLDVGNKAKNIWNSATSSVLISATLEDLTRGNFDYFKRSMGITTSKDIRVESPFTMSRQQLVYITKQDHPAEEGTVFSVEEIVDSVNASGGRSLLLFTSRKDLEMAHQMLLDYKVAGRFPYVMYVQTPDSDKAKLVDSFNKDTFSVLLGLKSMFTGIDIPGESLSNVIICRFPLSRYSSECKMKITYWRSQGFPTWYERDSLTVFQQAAGRLIRSEECIGVVSILDQRVNMAGSSVFKTAKTGIVALGSRVSQNLEDVTNHLGVLSEV